MIPIESNGNEQFVYSFSTVGVWHIIYNQQVWQTAFLINRKFSTNLSLHCDADRNVHIKHLYSVFKQAFLLKYHSEHLIQSWGVGGGGGGESEAVEKGAL